MIAAFKYIFICNKKFFIKHQKFQKTLNYCKCPWNVKLTAVAVNIDILVSSIVFVVVDVTNHNRQRVGPTHGGVTAVLHYYRQMVLLLLLTVKLAQTHHNPAAIAVLTTTLVHCTQQHSSTHEY